MFKAFYSDPHLGHANIIEYCKRPFKDIEEMNNSLITNYNMVIGKDDIVLWVGDCFFKGSIEHYKHIINQMNGHKVLIIGNHDKPESDMAALGFDLVMREGVLCINGVVCRVSHYPYDGAPGIRDKHSAKRPRRNPGEILLHGHSHNIEKVTGKSSINVGVDAWEFSPALYVEVAKLVLDLHKKLEH